MDYETNPVSRKEIREFAKLMRKAFGVPLTGKFPVLEMLEKLPDIFPNTSYIVLPDNCFDANNPARCILDSYNNFTIKIAEYVYENAYSSNGTNRGACLGFICHEICHVFLYKIGYRPILGRNILLNTSIPCYRSVEWQTKALAGEVMIPYDESAGLSTIEIVEKYDVSMSFAIYRQNY